MSEIGKQPNTRQLVRLLNIPAGFDYGVFSNLHGFENGRSLADHFKSMCGQNYGHIGPAFIRCLISDQRDFSGMLAEFIEKFCKDNLSTFSKLESRAATTFALIAMAGELPIQYNLLPWPEEAALFSVKVAFNQWREAQGSGQSEDICILENISNFIIKHDARFSLYMNGEENLIINNRAGWYKEKDKERIYLFLPQALDEAAGKFDRNRIIKALREARWLADQDKGRYTKKTQIPMGKKGLYYICVPDQE